MEQYWDAGVEGFDKGESVVGRGGGLGREMRKNGFVAGWGGCGGGGWSETEEKKDGEEGEGQFHMIIVMKFGERFEFISLTDFINLAKK